MESSRRIVMFNWMTANGYFAGADGNLDWVVPDEEQAKAAVDGIPLFDTVLFGRRTYELFEKFWNHPLDDSSTAPDPHHPGQRTLEHREIAIWLNEMTKWVFSKSLKDVTWKNSRVLHELDPREIETMKSRPGKDMIVFGSGSIVSQLTQHGFDRRVSDGCLPDLPRKRPAAAHRCVEKHETGARRGQAVPIGRRYASLRAVELDNALTLAAMKMAAPVKSYSCLILQSRAAL